MKNDYEINGDVTTIFVKYKETIVKVLINTSDLERIKTISRVWYARWDKTVNSFYIQGRLNNSRSYCLLHRIITNAPKGLSVDHINHDTLNNTRENLRVITQAQNSQNLKKARSDNKTGVRGVYYNKEKKKYEARLRVSGKPMFFGYFNSIPDAEKVIVEARKKYLPFSTN